jgi:hypothetical protein
MEEFFSVLVGYIIPRFANDDHVIMIYMILTAKMGDGKNKTNQCLEMFPKLYLNPDLTDE